MQSVEGIISMSTYAAHSMAFVIRIHHLKVMPDPNSFCTIAFAITKDSRQTPAELTKLQLHSVKCTRAVCHL